MTFLFYFFITVIGILMKIELNPPIALGNMDILTMSVIPIHEHRRSSHFIVSFPISFNKHCTFLSIEVLQNFLETFWVLDSGEWREKERERNINVWLRLTPPPHRGPGLQLKHVP